MPARSSYTLACVGNAPSQADIDAGVVPWARAAPPLFTSLRLHIKNLTRRIAFDQVLHLAGLSDETLARLQLANGYLNDRSTYDKYLPAIAPRDVQKARIPVEYTRVLVDANHFEPSPDARQVRASCFVFAVPEPAKNRARGIQHTAAINERLPPAPKVSFRSIHERCQLVHAGSHAAQIDFASFYPAFQLAPEVRDFFTAKLPVQNADGSTSWKLHRLCVGPTGMSHMVFVAVATSDAIIEFERRAAATDTHIDNILSVGEPAAIAHDLVELGRRCDFVGITINEDIADPNLISTELDWCGLHLDFTAKTASLTQKVLRKIDASWENRSRWSWRGFAAHIGLLFYAMQVIDVPVAQYFNLLRFVSAVGRDMQSANDQDWDRPAFIWDCAFKNLDEWTRVARRNTPRIIQRHADPPIRVLVDSCSWGWGYIALDELTDKLYLGGGPWSAEFVARHGAAKLAHSTFTEPRGIIEAKRDLLPQLESRVRQFILGTDNVPARVTFSRGYAARSFHLNDAAATDRSSEFDQRHGWHYEHVPGKSNIFADAISRGRDPTTFASEEHRAMKESLRRLLGVTPGGLSTGAGSDLAIS
jgi:hypothetical protein